MIRLRRSTFMVEMTETANILHNATAGSQCWMDEIGLRHLDLRWPVAAWPAHTGWHRRMHAVRDALLSRRACPTNTPASPTHPTRSSTARASYSARAAGRPGQPQLWAGGRRPPACRSRWSRRRAQAEGTLNGAARAQLPAEPDPQLPLFAPEPNAVVEALSGIDPGQPESGARPLAALYHLKPQVVPEPAAARHALSCRHPAVHCAACRRIQTGFFVCLLSARLCVV